MVKVVVRKLDAKNGKRREAPPARTAVRDSKGKVSHFFTIDVNGPTFENDLTFVYKHNVAKARNENKKLFGSRDGAKRSRAAK
jgi:hypothetical protein